MPKVSDANDVSTEQAQPSNTEETTEVVEEGNSQEEASKDNEEAESEKTETTTDEGFTTLNPEELPEELKPFYQNMLRDYTRKTQEIRSLKEKALLYDQQEQEKMIQQKFPKPVEKPSSETTTYLAQSLGVDVSTLAPEERQQLDFFAKMIDTTVNKRLAEHVMPLQNKMTAKEYQQELVDVMKRYPDFDLYKDDVKHRLQLNPNLSYEDAYKLSTYEEAERRGRAEAIKNQEVKKKQANLKTSIAKQTDEPDNSFDSIYKWAKRKLSS